MTINGYCILRINDDIVHEILTIDNRQYLKIWERQCVGFKILTDEFSEQMEKSCCDYTSDELDYIYETFDDNFLVVTIFGDNEDD